MSPELLTVLFCAVLGGVASAFAPLLIARIPEPEPEPEPVPDGAPDPEEGAPPEAASEPDPKVAYAEVAARRGLWWRAALFGAAGAAGVGWAVGWSWSLLVLLPLVPVLVALSVVDWHTRLLPTWVIKPTYFVTLATVVVAALASGDYADLWRSLLGWLAVGAFFFVLWFISPAGLGYGDVRLSGILGLALGHLGWSEVLTGVWSAFLVGSVGGAVLALLGVVDRKNVPFGPFMVVGAVVGVLAGPWVGARLG